MGATVWQRDGQGGKTFKTGIQQNPQRPGKRKLVWKREDQQVWCGREIPRPCSKPVCIAYGNTVNSRQICTRKILYLESGVARKPSGCCWLQAQRPDVPAQRYTAPPVQPSRPAAPVNGYKRPRTDPIPSGQVPRPAQPRASQAAAAAAEDWDGEVVFDLPDTEQNGDSGPSGSSGLHGTRSPDQHQSNGAHHQGNGSHLGAVNGQSASREQLEREAAERKVRAAQEELEALKRGIAEREQRLAREQVRPLATETPIHPCLFHTKVL